MDEDEAGKWIADKIYEAGVAAGLRKGMILGAIATFGGLYVLDRLDRRANRSKLKSVK